MTTQQIDSQISSEIQKIIIDMHLRHGIPIHILTDIIIKITSLCKPDVGIHPDEFTRRNAKKTRTIGGNVSG